GHYRSGYSTTLIVECPRGQSVAYVSSVFGAGRFPSAGKKGGGAGMTSYLFKLSSDNPIQHAGVIALDDLEPLCGLFDEQGKPDSTRGEWRTAVDVPSLNVVAYPLRSSESVYMICATGGG